MTIKKRLFWSNILMIAVPAVSAALTVLVCIGLVWLSLTGGAGLGIEDQEDFDHACMAISEMLEYDLGRNSDFSSVKSLLDSNQMSLQIRSDGKKIFGHGTAEDMDERLLSAAGLLDGASTVTWNGRSLYVETIRVKGTDYMICLFGSYHERQAYSGLKVALSLSVIVIIFVVFVSILLTNRFLTKFVFRRIEDALDTLAGGVHEIRDGNLQYRIVYDRKDEFLAVCEDFNEMAVRLKTSVDEMQRQELSRKELIAGISHDLRSPLTSIQAYVEGLLDGIARTPEAQRRYLETIKGKAQDLAHIISQLFLFSKMELGEYPEELRLLSLNEEIAKTVSAQKEEYERQGLEIHMELEPVQLSADPVYLHRIVINILENSLKYKKKERGNIWISLSRTKKGCRLAFADDGPGVPEESLSHLFEIFYRSDSSRQNPENGSGLGLAIVAGAVQRMGGSIQARRGEPKGLEIIIEFPNAGNSEVGKDGKDFDHRG